LTHKTGYLFFPFSTIKVKYGGSSPVFPVGRHELIAGQAYLEQFAEELWERGFCLDEIVVSGDGVPYE